MADSTVYDPLTGAAVITQPPRADAPKYVSPTEESSWDVPAELASDSFESAYNRVVKAGSDEGVAGIIPKSDSRLLNAFNRGVGYFADMGLAAVDASDAAMKYAIGAVAESVATDKSSQMRLGRDLVGMTEFTVGMGPSAFTGLADDITSVAKTSASKKAADEVIDMDFEDLGELPDGDIDWDAVMSELGLATPKATSDKSKLESYLEFSYQDYLRDYNLNGDTYGVGDRLKVHEAFTTQELKKLVEDMPHWQDADEYSAFLDKVYEAEKAIGVQPHTLAQILDDAVQYMDAPKVSKREAALTGGTKPMEPIGPRVGKGPQRPSDTKAETLGFNEHVYHYSSSPKEFTDFYTVDPEAAKRRGVNPHDIIGPHVGTAHAANIRATAGDLDPKGFVMELRARTDKPFTKQDAIDMFLPESRVQELSPGEELTERDISIIINSMADFYNTDEYTAAAGIREMLPAYGFTHIPYVNDIEDAGNVSYIMLIDRPKGESAVLRDVRAAFDPEKVQERDLRFAEGGVVTKGTQMDNLLETGGLNASSASVDPISGNEVPVGSTPKEVRDDIDAKLSENEYVVPADVVKFYGVHFFEKLRKKAKEGLAEMDAEGRIGGGKVEDEEGEMEDDDLPFDISELETIGGDDEPAFADGGVVTGPTAEQTAQWQSSWNPQNFQYGFSTTPQGSQLAQPQQQAAPQAQQTTTKTYVNESGRTIVITFDANGNPTTPIPEGFYELGTTPPRQQATEDRDPQEAYQRPDVSTYEIEDFQDVLDQADFTRGLARAAGVAAPPLGAAIQSGYNRTVQDSYAEINRRLEAGGLTPEQQSQLESLRDKFKDAGGTTEPTGISRVTNGLSGVFSGIIDAVTGRNTAQPSGREVEPGFYQQTQDDRDYTTAGGVRYTSTGPGSYQATGSTAPSSSPVPQSRPTSVRSSTSDNSSTVSATEAQQAARDFAEQNNTGLYGGGRAKGGLVTRKTKLKPSTPRKKVKVVEK